MVQPDITTIAASGHLDPMRKGAGWALLVWVGLQVAVVYSQDVFGARWFIPKRFLPHKYDYRRPIPESVLANATEQAEDEFGLMESQQSGTESRCRRQHSHDGEDGDGEEGGKAFSENHNSMTSTATGGEDNNGGNGGMAANASLTITNWVRRSRLGQWLGLRGTGGGQNGGGSYELVDFGRNKGHDNNETDAGNQGNGDGGGTDGSGGDANGGEQGRSGASGGGGGKSSNNSAAKFKGATTADCVICLTPVTLTGSAADYYISPCDHVFHPECLEQWMEQKMECPTCRQALPPL